MAVYPGNNRRPANWIEDKSWCRGRVGDSFFFFFIDMAPCFIEEVVYRATQWRKGWREKKSNMECAWSLRSLWRRRGVTSLEDWWFSIFHFLIETILWMRGSLFGIESCRGGWISRSDGGGIKSTRWWFFFCNYSGWWELSFCFLGAFARVLAEDKGNVSNFNLFEYFFSNCWYRRNRRLSHRIFPLD